MPTIFSFFFLFLSHGLKDENGLSPEYLEVKVHFEADEVVSDSDLVHVGQQREVEVAVDRSGGHFLLQSAVATVHCTYV